MEMVEIVKDLISTVGFPICCVVVMFQQMTKERESHEKESATWANAFNRNTDVLNQNTRVLEKLAELFKK